MKPPRPNENWPSCTPSDPRFAALDARLAAVLKGERRRTTPSAGAGAAGLRHPAVRHGNTALGRSPGGRSQTRRRPPDRDIATTPPAPRRWPVVERARTIHRRTTPPRSSCAARPSIGSRPNWLPGQRSRIRPAASPAGRGVDPRALEGRQRPRRHSRRCRAIQAAPRRKRRMQTALGRRRGLLCKAGNRK